MRVTHRQNPFHRIECWTGTHFRQAELWEVGTYILVQHNTDHPICQALDFQIQYLESFEYMKDQAEQESESDQADDQERQRPTSPHSASAPYHEWESKTAADSAFLDDETAADSAFLDHLDSLWDQGNGNVHAEHGFDDFFDGKDESEVRQANEDVHGFQPYLPSLNLTPAAVPTADATHSAAAVPRPDAVPTADALNNSYIRVVHTNGIHHMAMVTCRCQGEHRIPLDLVTSNLLPTSFTNIWTLFTVQVLDYFQLCNLELKASAYQSYQLIQRVTSPMRPAKVVNLYHELQRMSHLWRWMKRLKWAGYGHNQKDPLNPEPGTLANFCPACPQVGINLPENWKDDVNRWVSECLCSSVENNTSQFRFVFKRVFVADGNFKADHVRQKNSETDIWLWDGGGMAPNQAEYHCFLQAAIERLTVGTLP